MRSIDAAHCRDEGGALVVLIRYPFTAYAHSHRGSWLALLTESRQLVLGIVKFVGDARQLFNSDSQDVTLPMLVITLHDDLIGNVDQCTRISQCVCDWL